jgi:chromosome segregation ATPase
VSNLEAENQTKEQELSSLSEEVNAISRSASTCEHCIHALLVSEFNEQWSNLVGTQCREAQSYENAKSIEQLNSGAEQKEQRIAELEPALEEMRASAGSISDEQRDRLLNLAVTFFERWCARRRMFVSALDSICEHADQNVQSLKEEIGLEWDSDHGLDRKNCKQRVDHWRQQQQRRQMCRPAKTARTVQ